MSAGRFFVAPEILADPARVELPVPVANQARSVLRLQAGDHVTLLDNTGMACDVELTHISSKQVIGRIIERVAISTEPRAQVILYQGLLKATKFEWIIQKATEIGLSAIVPVQCRRSIVGAGDVGAGKLVRWRAIATEAAEQSDRGRVPEVREPLVFAAALAGIPSDDVILLAYGGEAPITTRAAMALRPITTPVHLFIGPEGGFAPEEVELARGQSARIVTLGPRILRAETAALVAATLVLDALGEMQ